MGAAFESFEHTQIVDVAVVVEIEVGDDVRVGVQDLLKLLNAVRLRKSGGNSLKVEVETDILRHG